MASRKKPANELNCVIYVVEFKFHNSPYVPLSGAMGVYASLDRTTARQLAANAKTRMEADFIKDTHFQTRVVKYAALKVEEPEN